MFHLSEDLLAEDDDALTFMHRISEEHATGYNHLRLKSWAYENNLTQTNRENYVRCLQSRFSMLIINGRDYVPEN